MFSRVTNRFRRLSVPSSDADLRLPLGPLSASYPGPAPSVSQYAPPPTPDGTVPPMSPSQPALEPHPDLDELPVYLAREDVSRSEHVFALKSKDTAWLTLRVWSSAGAPGSHPLYFDNALVEGSVELVLTQPQTIQTITVLLEGFTRTAGSEQKTFLSLPTLVYPPCPAPDSPTSKVPAGTHTWHFRFPLPPTVTIPYEGGEVIAPLPPTYSTKGFPAFLEYHLSVVLHRGALRVDTTLSTAIVYLPRSRPKPASAKRQIAYTRLEEPPGPEVDPEGWHAVEGLIKGVMFSKVDVEVRCTFHFARPLCYARGTSIPFLITFDSRDTQAVDLFTQPTSVKVVMEQIVTVGPDALRTKSAMLSPSTNASNTFGRIVGKGKCAIADESTPEWRRLTGEIWVPRDVKPSFTFVRFTLSYKVNLVVDAVGFVPEKGSHALSLSQEVALATDPPRGPRQPVTASSSGRRPSMDVGNADTVNLLLMGNQRYMQHHHAGGAPAG
ncbi:hypothetical protein CALVIDRAFT_595171 [Calocera viscosa TUFC12733]|uniref:Arrestin-like N-terminal domain-containing protein n=1 Tax=Calocera viscosa (strain TUFC12733) TaxID=1330018 RepID=A0A167QX69_CALVF|nr:hypothetical protein CALVIDRAFT_595171 [Calocera viscosa TUFC12733]